MRGGASVDFRTNISCRKLLVALLLISPSAAAVQAGQRSLAKIDSSVHETAQRLAERVASIPGVHGPLRLDWHPDALWPEGESQHWRDTLHDELENRSIHLTEDAGAPALEIFAQETPTQVVLSAYIAEHDDVRIVGAVRSFLPPAELPVAPVRLERQLIYESPDRILDASSLWNDAEGGFALVLYKNFEVVAMRIDAQGVLKQTVPLTAANIKPSRDPRALMAVHGGRVTVQLASKACDFSWETKDDVKCHAEKFTPQSKSSWREDPLLTSPCDASSWKLLSSGSEPTTRDVLQVVPDGALRESSTTVTSEFSGPILSMNGEQNPQSALIVARNLRTGNYEVYKITLACGN